MKDNILVLDDEKDIVDILDYYLTNEGYNVLKFIAPKEAISCIENEKIDLAILDVMLPEVSGFYICKKIRELHKYPILMLTAKDSFVDMINGLSLGADDYITKPFEPLEVVARVKAQIRRYKIYNGNPQNEILEYLGLQIDRKKRVASFNGRDINLTGTEYLILQILLENIGSIVKVDEIFHFIWKDEYYLKNNNTVAVHIRNIRKKICDYSDKETIIKTVWGVGYKIG